MVNADTTANMGITETDIVGNTAAMNNSNFQEMENRTFYEYTV